MTSNPRMRGLALGIVFICMKPSHAADSIQVAPAGASEDTTASATSRK